MVDVDVLQLTGLAARAHGVDKALRSRSHGTQMDVVARFDHFDHLDATLAAVECADHVIAVINKNVPRAFGQAMIPISKTDMFCREDPRVGITYVHHQHAGVVVDEIVDGFGTHEERGNHLAGVGLLGLAVTCRVRSARP